MRATRNVQHNRKAVMQSSIITTPRNVIDPTWIGTAVERQAAGIVDRHTVDVPELSDEEIVRAFIIAFESDVPDSLSAGDRVTVQTGARERMATVAYTYADGATVGIRFDGGAHVNVYPSSVIWRAS
jgi:hypothetical protein